ncbi:MAG: hypothetical protein FWH26_08450 [Oscillospiraceae bacterium]|nr:hypothetical protein [Oscillospiraceae bacterium]
MRKKRKMIIVAAALVLAGGAALAVFLLRQPVNPPPKPELLPDSGALALPVAANFTTNLVWTQQEALWFPTETELREFIGKRYLRPVSEKGDYRAELTLPEEYNFETHNIFFAFTLLSSLSTPAQCYLQPWPEANAVELRASIEIADPERLNHDQLLQGYLVALDKNVMVFNEETKISFSVEKTIKGETTTNPYENTPYRLELVEADASRLRVRLADTAESGRWQLKKATYYTLYEYRGYRWQLASLLPGKLPTEVGFEALSLREFALSLSAYPALEPGRPYRAVLQISVEDESGAERTINTAVEFTV